MMMQKFEMAVAEFESLVGKYFDLQYEQKQLTFTGLFDLTISE